MSLNRLENFLRTAKGTVIYVNVDGLDATDSIENTGTSLARPFKTPQRALIEAVRYSYISGTNNDLYGNTTIIVFPGQYDIDNRPGVLIKNDGSLLLRSSQTATLPEWKTTTNFNVYDSSNQLYKLNSVYGGVIVPRGITIWCYDSRKTVFRPLYVPSPINNNIERSCIFRRSAGTVLENLAYSDVDPNGFCYEDYTTTKLTPNFSHHKLDCYQDVDGVNNVIIQDDFLNVTTSRTDLEMYYEKISLIYGLSSGREIQDAIYSPNISVDIQPVIDEIRIIGSTGNEVGITSIWAGDGIIANNTITVTLEEPTEDLNIDTPIQISGVGVAGYDGQNVVSSVISSSQIQYTAAITPTVALPSSVGATLNIVVDSITSDSPLIKNNSLRSVYGMCGYYGNGNNVSGFKSFIVDQFEGISLQKDDNAFVKYDYTSGTYKDSTAISNLHSDPNAHYKPDYEHYFLRLDNNTSADINSCSATGFAQQYLVNSGSEISMNASKSKYGAKALSAVGFKDHAFSYDDGGYLAGVIPPKFVDPETSNIYFGSFDVGLTTSVGNSTKLYIADAKNFYAPPQHNLFGYNIGAKRGEVIKVELSNNTTVGIYTATVLIPSTNLTSEKVYTVPRINNNTENSIFNNAIDLTTSHNFITGEKIRILSENGHLPDGLSPNKVGYAITTSLLSTKVKVAETYNDALANVPLNINKKGGNLTVVSRVSDKKPGEIGHPIQWDSTNNNWFINVNSNNSIYNQLNTLGTSVLSNYTSSFYIERVVDTRSDDEKIFKFRYILPSNTPQLSRPPLKSFILQESNDVVLDSVEMSKYFSTTVSTLISPEELRISHYISDVTWSSNVAIIKTELPSEVTVGSKIELVNFIGGLHTVSSIINNKKFTIPLTTNPGVFNKDTTTRNQNLPYFKKVETNNTYKIHEVKELQEYIYNKQDGVYDLTLINTSNSPTVSPFTDLKFSQPLKNLYPLTDVDNLESDPKSTTCFAIPDKIGEVIVNNEFYSITKETHNKLAEDFYYGIKVSNIVSDPTGIAHTFTTQISHNFRGITNFTLLNAGSNYVPGTYYGADVIASTGSGRNANVRLTISGGGTVSDLEIMDSGCAYCVGDTATLIPSAGIGTTSGFIPATILVTNVIDNINDTLYLADNNIPFRITVIEDHNKIQVASPTSAVGLNTSYCLSAGKAAQISSFSYNASTGIATATCAIAHGNNVNETIRLGGFDSDYFNKEAVVIDTPSVQSLVINIGKEGLSLPTTGTRYIYPTITANNEKPYYFYAGITAKINSGLSAESNVDILVIDGAINVGLNIGDFIKVNDEIFRIKSDITSNNVSVFRAQMGTIRQTHSNNSAVKKIKIVPLELRKSSTVNSSSHIFESVGIGPGNYSTSIPDRLNKTLTEEEKSIAQYFMLNGGTVTYVIPEINKLIAEFYDKNPYVIIQGRKIGVGTTTPSSGNYGDIIYSLNPKSGNYVGWTYTIDNKWKGFGMIGS
jgi:hypothetical protein